MEKLKSIINNDPQVKEPGFLIKTHCRRGKFKFFINFCHSNSISPPTIKLDEKDLSDLIEREQYETLSRFTVPMVIEKLESTRDKKGEPAKLTNVIVNSKFYQECIANSIIYQNYLVYIAIDTINAKFDLDLSKEFIFMKNKRYQLAENVSEFPRIIHSFIPTSIKVEEKNDPEPMVTDSTICDDDNEPDRSLMKNLIITLDVANDQITIKMKVPKNDLDGLKLSMNDDHVILRDNDGQKLNDFYLPVSLKFDAAQASLKNRVLSIQCPVEL